MSADSRHNPEPPERSPWGIATVALLAATLQVVASIALGLARLDRFNAAAGESPGMYLVVAALLGVAGLSIWLVRERMIIALTLAVLWPVGLWLSLRAHVTALGLAYHGEFVLHHFAAVLCLVLAIGVPIGWARDMRLGKLRVLPAALAVGGALLLGAAHFGQVPIGPAVFAHRSLPMIGAAMLLLAWPSAAIVYWRQLGPRERRPLVWVLLLPLAVRVTLADGPALDGALVPEPLTAWVGGAIVVTSVATLIILRPRLERWVLAVIGIICLLGSMFVYYLYENGFGEFEDGLGGLLESLFGFVVPYPSYVDDARSAALMMGLFFTLVTVYAALVSTEDRIRGVALGLMVVAGLGFSSPHLVLMYGTGALLLLETLLPGAPYRELDDVLARFEPRHEHDGEAGTGEFVGVEQIIEGLAERLGLEPPTVVEPSAGVRSIGLRGEVGGTAIDVRARFEPRLTVITLIVGLPGRGAPVVELVPSPGQGGSRPAHLLARSHKVRGEQRALEVFGDAPLDALTCFPTAHLRAWDGGAEVELGRELVGLRVDHLEALVRSLARAFAPAGPS